MSNLFVTRSRFLATLLIVATFGIFAADNCYGQKKTSEQVKAKIAGKVVDRKKYNFVIDDGKTKHKVVIANVGHVYLKLNRPLFDFEKKTVSVVPEGSVRNRKFYPIPDALFFKSKFAHQKQQERFMSIEQKRLSNFVISPEKPGKLKSLEIGGEFKKGSKQREYLLETKAGKLNVMLGPNGRLDGLNVTQIKPGDQAQVTVMLIDNQLVAQSIEFQPSKSDDDSSK